MRIFTALCLTLTLAACGDDSGKNDLSSNHDLSASSGDMSKQLGCFALITCASGCNGASACEQACLANGSTAGVQEFNTLFGCAYGLCLPSDAGDVDGGAGSCASTDDTSAACQACLTSNAESAACGTQLSACEADTQGT